jgi:hypothetical protein
MYSSYIIGIKEKRLMGHATCMAETKNSCQKILNEGITWLTMDLT